MTPIGDVTIRQLAFRDATARRVVLGILEEIVGIKKCLSSEAADHLLRRVFVDSGGVKYDPGDEPAITFEIS